MRKLAVTRTPVKQNSQRCRKNSQRSIIIIDQWTKIWMTTNKVLLSKYDIDTLYGSRKEERILREKNIGRG